MIKNSQYNYCNMPNYLAGFSPYFFRYFCFYNGSSGLFFKSSGRIKMKYSFYLFLITGLSAVLLYFLINYDYFAAYFINKLSFSSPLRMIERLFSAAVFSVNFYGNSKYLPNNPFISTNFCICNSWLNSFSKK